MVKYFHCSNSVQDIKLSINQVFFVVVVAGEIRLKTPKSTVKVQMGESALISEGSYIMSEGLCKKSNEFKAYLFFLPKTTIKDYFSNSRIFNSKPTSKIESDILLFNHTDFLRDYVENSSYLFQSEIDNKVLLKILESKITELLHFFALNKESEKIYQMLFSSVEESRYEIESIVRSNYLNDVSIEDLAFLCNTSTSTFKRQFKEIFGESPKKWITSERMQTAERLMLQGRKTISEVAMSCGYKSLTSFARPFKKTFGVSPSEYSKKASVE